MNIREQLLIEHSKENSAKIRDYIGTDEKRFRELLYLFLHDEYRVSQRSAMAVSACYDAQPELVSKFRVEIIENLLHNDVSVAVKRNSIRILQFMEIPEAFQAPLFDYSLLMLYSEEEPVAIKAFSMGLASNLCEDFPELKEELKAAIELNMEQSDKAGIRSRGKNILKKLDDV